MTRVPQNGSAAQIVILGDPRETPRIVYRALAREFVVARVVIEERVPRRTLLARRLKRLGVRKVVGQVLFWLVVPRVFAASSRARISSLKKAYD